MGNGFGEKLRAERLERGMTQAELGKDLYSPSYISLLETGRREPTAEVIEELARRLELAPKALEAWSQPISVSDAEYVLAGLYARQAWDLRDYPLAASHAASAAQIALEGRNTSAWWNMSYMQAECLLKHGDLLECRQLTERLLEHPMARESAGLGARARQMLAVVYQRQGQLTTAVDLATDAVAVAQQLSKGSIITVGAYRALIGALAESGRLDDAWKYCQDLLGQVDEDAMTQLAGEVAWVVGNVAFMRHDYTEGVKHHERAARLLSPANDIELWARFNKASAAVRLSSGIVEPETLAAIERAELAFSIVSGTKSDELEVAFIRARWLYLTGDIVAAVEKLREIHAERAELAKHTAGEVSLLLGKSLKASGELDEALVHLEEARKAFATAGAQDRVQQALDAILEIKLAQKRAAASSKAS
ncbi:MULTISPECIES: helix-turn-helix domain-containing protein [unclassified Arthrobacter]|uniref:helix-turn-helix domain-containing protein n=1 Tax=unclassified Arthrobacter TaxID=235627 RepID=UPI0012F3D41B|nr:MULTISPECIES: helix-turn-helix transcriptional regulator [unclassified Arthrobacter]MDE8589122.1 helix-turn-helix transcriptional regulator [Arthrobacter sp. NQ4]BCW80087.1 transcriptional regulator [Arthrobacter sp. NicSoilC5]VXC48895.1 XRE family transcriptional regulator [Arthrobacter sp. 8AJ]